MKTATTPKIPDITVDGIKMKLRFKESGWIEGSCDGYKFWAKISDYGSGWGIEDGRVYKLEIHRIGKNDSGDLTIAYYERGWDIIPKSKDFAIYRKILCALEAVPIRPELSM